VRPKLDRVQAVFAGEEHYPGFRSPDRERDVLCIVPTPLTVARSTRIDVLPGRSPTCWGLILKYFDVVDF